MQKHMSLTVDVLRSVHVLCSGIPTTMLQKATHILHPSFVLTSCDAVCDNTRHSVDPEANPSYHLFPFVWAKAGSRWVSSSSDSNRTDLGRPLVVGTDAPPPIKKLVPCACAEPRPIRAPKRTNDLKGQSIKDCFYQR